MHITLYEFPDEVRIALESESQAEKLQLASIKECLDQYLGQYFIYGSEDGHQGITVKIKKHEKEIPKEK